MSKGLPSLDLNMDALPEGNAGKDLPFKPFSAPPPAGAKTQENPIGSHSAVDVSASLLEVGNTSGFDSTQQVPQNGRAQPQSASIPDSSAFWENGESKSGRPLVTGPRLLGAKGKMAVSSLGHLPSGPLRLTLMIGVFVPLLGALLFMNPDLLNFIPGWNQSTSEETAEAKEGKALVPGESQQAESSAASNDSSSALTPATAAENRVDADLTWQENPYWFLPNELDQKVASPTAKWNPEQEEAWGSSTEGSIMWAKYQSLFEIRKTPVLGAEQVLWKLSKGKKFWLRMMSLMALADMGQKIETVQVEQAIQGVNPELMSRFLTRFAKKSTIGERLILRHLLKLVNEDDRLSILSSLAFQKDRFAYLYLVAGTFDPGISASKFSKRQLAKVQPEELERLEKVVKGELTFDQAPPSIETRNTEGAKNVPSNTGKPLTQGVADQVGSSSANGVKKEGLAASPDGGVFTEVGEDILSAEEGSKVPSGESLEDTSHKVQEGSEEGSE